jgi:GcrA cell cycle regulator
MVGVDMAKKTNIIKTLIDLSANDCRWPEGDPRHADFHFCGAPKMDGRPYCAQHWALSFMPSRPRHQTSTPALMIRQAA